MPASCCPWFLRVPPLLSPRFVSDYPRRHQVFAAAEEAALPEERTAPSTGAAAALTTAPKPIRCRISVIARPSRRCRRSDSSSNRSSCPESLPGRVAEMRIDRIAARRWCRPVKSVTAAAATAAKSSLAAGRTRERCAVRLSV